MWKRTDEDTPVKAKRGHSARIVHLTVFWDAEEILLEEYSLHSQTVNEGSYFNTLIRLHQAIKEKRRGKLSKNYLYSQKCASTQGEADSTPTPQF